MVISHGPTHRPAPPRVAPTAPALTNPRRLRPGSQRGSSPLAPHRTRLRGAPTATAPVALSPTSRPAPARAPDASATARAAPTNDAVRHAPTPAGDALGTHGHTARRTGRPQRRAAALAARMQRRPAHSTRHGARPPPARRLGPARSPAQTSARPGALGHGHVTDGRPGYGAGRGRDQDPGPAPTADRDTPRYGGRD